jgi:hypothetical protein
MDNQTAQPQNIEAERAVLGGILCENGSLVLHRTTLYKQGYLRAIRRSGVPRIPFHNLRHTYASLLIAQGEQPKYIQEQMGHSSIKVTFDVYGHLMEKVNVRSANRIAMTVFGEDRGGSSSETVADSEKRETGTGNLLN